MHLISGSIPDAARLSVQPAGAKDLPQLLPPCEWARSCSPRPATDQYIPEQKQPPSGRYWLKRDGAGRQTVFYDDPQQPADGSERPKAGDTPVPGGVKPPQNLLAQPRQAEDDSADDTLSPDRVAEGPEGASPEESPKHCTVDTGRGDREIEALKKQKQEIERRLKAETDETKARELQAEADRIEQELTRKDNDAYRRGHAQYSFL